MKPAMRSLLGAALLASLLILGVALGAWAAGGTSLSFSRSSPDGRERLDFYHATHWQAMRLYNAEMPGFVRLVRVAGDETLGTSEAFDLDGSGPVLWDKKRVLVGTSAQFDRTTGRWDVKR